MPTSTECIFNDEKINIKQAIRLKQKSIISRKVLPIFRCISCNQPVNPHGGGKPGSEHFEHFKRNAACPLSHKARLGVKKKSLKQDFDIDDEGAFEGYSEDRTVTFRNRNKKVVAECKRINKHTCQACGFKLRINGKYIIECHHIRPLAVHGVRETTLNDLLCLCPTCHRIAHTRLNPFSLEEIRVIVNK